MYKKIMMACMAIAAFAAFVVAPAASASPVLTDKNGGSTFLAIPAGASITGTNTGTTTFTAGGLEVHCSNVHLTGTVTKNTGTKIAGEIPLGGAQFGGTGTNGDCTSGLGSTKVTVTSKLCLETVTGTDNVVTTGCVGASVKFDLEITGTGNCEYSTPSVTGTFPTGDVDATVTVWEQPSSKIAGGIFCPSSGKLDMHFDLYTTNGETITIS